MMLVCFPYSIVLYLQISGSGICRFSGLIKDPHQCISPDHLSVVLWALFARAMGPEMEQLKTTCTWLIQYLVPSADFFLPCCPAAERPQSAFVAPGLRSLQTWMSDDFFSEPAARQVKPKLALPGCSFLKSCRTVCWMPTFNILAES